MNFLVHQTLANGGEFPDGPHFVHCCIYEGAHCTCGGNYRGDQPGMEVVPAAVVTLAEQAGC
ncbi:hypothetical protein AB0I84_35590 [Streptomyces spectabilis]|uniref:hypothetical protein n=1 Tax=Streptomyces spectabilis TaxID=68270 RepID=UPI0033EED8FF